MYIVTLQGFKDVVTAEIARLDLVKMKDKGALDLEEAVVITKSPKGEVRLKQSFSFTPNATIAASWLGTLVGACIGIPFGPLGPLIGTFAGATLGAAIGALTDVLEIQELKSELAETFDAGNSAALLVVTDEANAPKIFDGLRKLNTINRIVQKILSKETEGKLKKAVEAHHLSSK
jgi:uncharacterized membrane protein